MGNDHGIEKTAHNGGTGLGDASGFGRIDDFRSSVQGSISARKRGTEPLYCPKTGLVSYAPNGDSALNYHALILKENARAAGD